jgi:hypothetical protein
MLDLMDSFCLNHGLVFMKALSLISFKCIDLVCINYLFFKFIFLERSNFVFYASLHLLDKHQKEVIGCKFSL